jgi:hypothetical protein
MIYSFRSWIFRRWVCSFALCKPKGVESLQTFPNQEDFKKLNVDWSESKHIDPYQASKQTWNKESKAFSLRSIRKYLRPVHNKQMKTIEHMIKGKVKKKELNVVTSIWHCQPRHPPFSSAFFPPPKTL